MKARQSFLSTGHRYFLAVAETQSVRAAARGLNVAASAISRQIIALERDHGVPLFERSARALTLTPAGEALLQGLRRAAQESEETAEHIDGLRGLKRGRLRIASVESLSVSFLPDVLVSFGADLPGIEAAITIAGSDAVTELVRSHQADIGLTFNPTSLEGLEAVISRDFHIGAIMAPRHPLAKSKSVTLAECLNHRIAWPARGLSLRLLLDRARGQRSGTVPAIECNSLRMMAALARRGHCIAFQPRIGIEQDVASRALVWVPVKDRRLASDRFVIVCRKGHGQRALLEAFLTTLRSHLPSVRNEAT